MVGAVPCQVELFQQVIDPRSRRAADGQFGLDGGGDELVFGILEHVSHRMLAMSDGLPADGSAGGGGAHQPCQRGQQRRLAGTVGSDQGDELAATQPHRHLGGSSRDAQADHIDVRRLVGGPVVDGIDDRDLTPPLGTALEAAHLAGGAEVAELRGQPGRGPGAQVSRQPHPGAGQLVTVLAEDLARWPAGYDPAVSVKRQDLVDDGQYRVEVVVDDDDPHAAGDEPRDQCVEVALAGGVDGAGGFVEDQQPGTHGEGDGHREALPLPAGQRPGIVPDPVQEPDAVQRVHHPRADLVAGKAQVLQREGDVVVNGPGDHRSVGILPDVGDVTGDELDGGVGDLGAGQLEAARALGG